METFETTGMEQRKIKFRYIAMQFTGLHDRTGKEIYEGDILTNGNEEKFECIFWEGCFVAKLYGTEKKDEQGYHALNVLNVIGNIYDNPELKEVKEVKP